MQRSKDPEKIKQETLENMRMDGTMNYLQAKYISLVASSIKNNEEFQVLKPYKIVRTDKPYLIASQIALQYFKKKNLALSFETISDETDGLISFSNPDIVSDSLNIHSDDVWMTELLNDWEAIKPTIKTKNQELFFKSLQKRLDEVLPETEKQSIKSKGKTPQLRSVASKSPKQVTNPTQIQDVDIDNSFDDFDNDNNSFDDFDNTDDKKPAGGSTSQPHVDVNTKQSPNDFDQDFPYQSTSNDSQPTQQISKASPHQSPPKPVFTGNAPIPLEDDSIHFDSDDADSMGFDEPAKQKAPPQSPPKSPTKPQESSPKSTSITIDDFPSDYSDEDIPIDNSDSG